MTNQAVSLSPGVTYIDLSHGRRFKSLVLRRFYVPASFWDDHSDRCPCDDPEADMAQELSRAGRRVLIEGSEKQIETLRADAAFYAGDNVDDCRSLQRSAQATLEAIAKALP